MDQNSSTPKIICLCGSTRFYRLFEQANLAETLQGHIVLSIGANAHDATLSITQEQKIMLDNLHLKKILMSNEVLVINHGGYIGPSTRNEIKFAERHDKLVRYLEFHTDSCSRETIRTTQDQDAYIARWPNYCQECNSLGQSCYTYDPSPPGVSLSAGYMEDCDSCPKCVELGRCPRCGEYGGIDEEGSSCNLCHWMLGDDGLPQLSECFCYELICYRCGKPATLSWENVPKCAYCNRPVCKECSFVDGQQCLCCRDEYCMGAMNTTPYNCSSCGKELSFPQAFFLGSGVYCADCLPEYDKHQQW